MDGLTTVLRQNCRAAGWRRDSIIIRGWKICTKKWPKYACKYALKREKICIYICIYALKYAVNWSFSLITHDKNQNSFLLFIYLHMFIYKLKRNY
jgi:hypothetical protein